MPSPPGPPPRITASVCPALLFEALLTDEMLRNSPHLREIIGFDKFDPLARSNMGQSALPTKDSGFVTSVFKRANPYLESSMADPPLG
jgi:hypothetical protein